MADMMNVMNLIKKKGPKKLRGPAGAAAKKRLNKPAVQKVVFNKNNPFKSFLSFSDNEMYEQILNYTQNLSPLSDRQLIKMFSILRNGIPWTLVKPFFEEYDNSDSNNIVSFFENYIKRSVIKSQIDEMRDIILSRQTTPMTLTRRAAPRTLADIVVSKPILLPHDPTIPRKPMFGPGDIPSICEQEYRRAPWMYKFIKEPIRGFALKDETPIYTTALILSPSGDAWYKASQQWYREACSREGREFKEGKVAYVTATGDIIVETKEMYETSKRDWKYILDIEFSPVNEQSFDAAKTLLKDNPILSHYSSRDIDSILASISGNAEYMENHVMARKLSRILVFLSKLTKEPQIYHHRVRNHQYAPQDLLSLDRYTLLPEIYKNPDANSGEIEYLLKSRRRFIENQFYSRLQPVEIGKRKRTSPTRPDVFKYLTTDAHSKCPPALQDIIYYEEDGVLYCFNRNELVDTNPVTGKPLSRKFLNELARINPNSTEPNVDMNTQAGEIVRERQIDKELAPGLFQKLKEKIAFSDNILHCSFCNNEVMDPKYKSIKGTQNVQFCEQECFDQFQF